MLNVPMLSEMLDFLLKQYHITMMQMDMDVFDENNKMESTIRVAFNTSNPHIYLDIDTRLRSLNIGIWKGKTADIDVWDMDSGEVLYGYHDYFDNIEALKKVILEAFSHLKL
ncbi:MAG TPA: hypothetical protein PLZ51_14665 [Aggregatilineales bacterium]|nr:hypothetical protein [Aggregatilineales bacterium]